MIELIRMAEEAKAAARALAAKTRAEKDAALFLMAESLTCRMKEILEANAKDVEAAMNKGLSAALIERLTLNEKRVIAMADGLMQTAALPDPIGREERGWMSASGIYIRKVSTPLGVIGIIYESRPNVTSDAAGLCLKSGNACILRGGSEAFNTNCAVVDALCEGASQAGLPKGCVSLVRDISRETATAMMGLRGYIDVLIPRGNAGLINAVAENSRIPVIETGIGVCHVYAHCEANLEMAHKIAVSAKISRPSVCNAAETLLVDEAIADRFLPGCAAELREKGVKLFGCEKARAIVPFIQEADEAAWGTEYLDLIYNVRVVSGIGEAIAHIDKYGTRHSECIVTNNIQAARVFQQTVDAAAVYVNASTRFTDGEVFGFGAEIGISTQKLHARGPMGLEELTSHKYLIEGDGQIR